MRKSICVAIVFLILALPVIVAKTAISLEMPHPVDRPIMVPADMEPPDPPQTNVFAALGANNAFTGNNSHSGTETFMNGINSNALQVNGISGLTQCIHADSSGNFTGTGLDCTAGGVSLTTDNTWTNNNRFKGPDPLVDITAFGARTTAAVNGFTTTASCVGTTAITLVSASAFQNGDGITIYGCGANNTLSSPGAPTVTPSIASGGTSTGIVRNSGTGSTTVSYEIVARTKNGGLTAAGTATTISECEFDAWKKYSDDHDVQPLERFRDLQHVVLNPLVANALIHITGSSDPDFDGWFIVSTINSGTQFVINNTPIDSRGLGWKFGDSASTTGGNIAFYLSNHVTWTAVANAWEYYVYMQTGGSGNYNLIGQTMPSADTWVDVQFDDYGSTIMGSQTYPDYVPSTAPVSPTNDPLSTTIVSGAGTTSIVVANAATQTIASQTAWFDDGPAIKAAAAAAVTAQGTLYIPPGYYYPVHSHIIFPTFFTIRQSGYLELYETVEMTGNLNWFGDWGQHGSPQFAFMGGASVDLRAANPGIYAKGADDYIAFVTIDSTGTNGGTLFVSQDQNMDFDYVNFYVNQGSTSDYLGRAAMFRSTTTGGNSFHFRKALFNSGPNQVTDKSWTPLVYFPPNQNGSGGLNNNNNYFVRCMECFLNIRGFEEELAGGSAGTFEFDGAYRQGGITPFLMIGNSSGLVGGAVMLHNIVQDTEAVGSLALLGNGGSFGIKLDASYVNNNSADGNGAPPPFTGYTTSSVRMFGSATGTAPNTSTEQSAIPCSVTSPFAIAGTNTCITAAIDHQQQPMDFPSGHSLFWDLQPPATITVGAATGGGSLTAGTYYYTASATGVDGGETVPTTAAVSGTTSAGNLTLPVSWTIVPGAVTYNVYRCSSTCVYTDGRIRSGNWGLISRLVTGLSINDTGLGSGQIPPAQTGTGVSGMNPAMAWAPKFITSSNCASSASPALCGSASSGAAVVAAAATTVVVDTTAVTANSVILLTPDYSLGTKLSATCNTGDLSNELSVSARSAGVSFTVKDSGTPSVNPDCFSYLIIN